MTRDNCEYKHTCNKHRMYDEYNDKVTFIESTDETCDSFKANDEREVDTIKNDNKIVFDLFCPPLEDNLSNYYLGLVEFLVNQLRKYTEVEVLHEEVFDAFHQQINRENEERAFYTICQKARLDGTSIEELVEKYGFETLGFSRETYEKLNPKHN